MTFVKQVGSAPFGAALLLGAGLCAPPAQAAYIVTLAQVGSNVVATGSGTIDLTGLSPDGGGAVVSGIIPSNGAIVTGPTSAEPIAGYTGFTGPASFGSGTGTDANTGSGNTVGIVDAIGELVVPAGYVSGSALADTSTYDSQTFATLGATPGTYVWTWSAPATATDDSFTLDIVAAAVPEPASLLLLVLPLGLVLLLAARPRRVPRAA